MKKNILVLLMLVSPLMAQEAEKEQTTKTGQKLSKYEIWLYEYRGYNSREEQLKNYFLMLSIDIPLGIVLSDFNSPSNKFSQISIEYTALDHHKNKFYFTYSLASSFLWNDEFLLGLKSSIGFGGTFFDSRNEIGKGWLVGMDWESGTQIGYTEEYKDDQYNVFTGINFRGIYKTETRIGFTVAFQILYHYYPENKDALVPDRHELSIGPKIGLVF